MLVRRPRNGRALPGKGVAARHNPDGVSVVGLYADSAGGASAQTYTTFFNVTVNPGNRAMVAATARRDAHANGLAAGWGISDTAGLTWSKVASSGINSSPGANSEMETVLFISNPVGSSTALEFTIDAQSGGTSLFFYTIQVFELIGSSGTVAQSAQAASATTHAGTPTFSAAPSGYQLLTATAYGDLSFWDPAPTGFTTVTGAGSLVTGRLTCFAIESSSNTGTAVPWSYTISGTDVASNWLLVELT